MSTLEVVFVKAHARYRNHDDGRGRCVVCGAAIDFEAWLDTRD